MSKEEHDAQACCGACAYAALVAQNPALEPISHAAPLLVGETLTLTIRQAKGEPKRVSFAQGRVTVGRVVGNDLVLPSATVSRKTCAFFFEQGTLFVEDLRSTCGTYINGRTIHEPTPLHRGDRVHIGDYVLTPDAD